MPIRRGFTLIELLIVIAILGILATLGIANFQNARVKARDVNRKSDLQTIAKSLEAYVNDHKNYPLSSGGKIICEPPATICDWNTPFQDENNTLYTAKLPKDPSTGLTYVYESTGTTYTLYAQLENDQDPAINATIVTVCGTKTCNYKVTSSNIQ